MYFSMCVVFHVAVIKLRQCDQLREQLLKSSRRTTGVLREIPLNLYVFWLRRSGSSENSSNMSLLFLPFLTRIFAADCPAGSYSSLNRTCSLCPRGTYQPSRGRPSCISCGPSFTTHSSGTVDKEHCISKSIKSAVIFHVEYVKFLCISGPHFLHKRS